MRANKVVAGLGVVLLLWVGLNQYTQYAENKKLAAQKAADDAKVSVALAQAKDAFTKGSYAEVRMLLEPYRTRDDKAITQFITNADKAEVLAYQLEQSDFYKKNPPVEISAWELKTGSMNYSYSFSDASSSHEKVVVEFNHDKTGSKHVAVMWHGSNTSAPATLAIEKEQFITGLVSAIFPQIEVPKLIAYIRANQNKSVAKSWDALPRNEINGIRVYVGVDSPTLMVGFGGGASEELLKIVEYAPNAVECKVLIKQWLADGTSANEIADVLPKAKSNGRCYDKPASASTFSESDPRTLFKIGAHFESNELPRLLDKHFPNAKYFPNQTVQVVFESKQYVILTQKLNRQKQAIYEILAVLEL